MSEATLSAPLFFQKQFERLTSFLCCSLYLWRRRGHSAEEGAPRRASLSSGVSRGGKVSRHIHTEIPLFPLTVRETPAQVPDPASKEEPQNLLRESLPSRPEPGPQGHGWGLHPLWGGGATRSHSGLVMGLPFCLLDGLLALGCCPQLCRP